MTPMDGGAESSDLAGGCLKKFSFRIYLEVLRRLQP
jgi:hypothetical protein